MMLILVVRSLLLLFLADSIAALLHQPPQSFVGKVRSFADKRIVSYSGNTIVKSNVCWGYATELHAKKKRRGGKSQGFGKQSQPDSSPVTSARGQQQSASVQQDEAREQPPGPPSQSMLKSVDGGAVSSGIPVMEKPDDDSEQLPPEERTKKILREKYGMQTLEERQLSEAQLEAARERQKKMNEWKKQAEAGKDLDIMAMVPGPVLVAIDTFLKAGIAITGTAFIGAGLAITAEAWSKTSGDPLPEDIDSFIVNVVEPNFTTGLLVLLGFSVSLGLFAAAQLGSEGAQYRED